ncbi:MAG: N-acetyltransferase [Ignavibacteriaceae bacterium]|nr:N-acetyltransferase [Ignavibacteriaceae bacterium]
MSVINDKNENRFVLNVDGNEVYVLYAESKNFLELYSTFTPPTHRGKGFAEKVVRSAFDYAIKKNLSVIPTCWYVKKFVDNNSEYQKIIKQ